MMSGLSIHDHVECPSIIDESNPIGQIGNAVKNSNCGSYEFGCALGLYIVSTLLSSKITISIDYGYDSVSDDIHPQMPILVCGRELDNDKIITAFGFADSLIEGSDRLLNKSYFITPLEIKNYRGNPSILVPNLEKVLKTSGTVEDVMKNFDNHICCITEKSLNDAFFISSDSNLNFGVEEIFLKSLCIDPNKDINGVYDEKVLSEAYISLKKWLWDLVDSVSGFEKIVFRIGEGSYKEVMEDSNFAALEYCQDEDGFSENLLKLLSNWQNLVYPMAVFNYMGSLAFLDTIKNANKMSLQITIKVPDEYVKFALTFMNDFLLHNVGSYVSYLDYLDECKQNQIE